MLNFFHNISAGIVSIFVAITGIFQTQPEAIVLSPSVQVVSTTTVEVASSTTKSDKVQSTIIVNKSVNNSTQTQNEIKKQLEASLVVKASNDTLTARQKAEEDARSKASNVAEENQKNTDLLKQLTELKNAVTEQSNALNKIASNIPSIKVSSVQSSTFVPVELQPFTFSPVIEIGGKNNRGFIHPEWSRAGCLGCDVTDIGWVYITINEQFDEARITLNDGEKNHFTNRLLTDPKDNSIKSGSASKLDGIEANKTYSYKIIATKAGFATSTVTGQFTSRGPRIVNVADTNGYIFMSYGIDEYISQIKLRVKTDIDFVKILSYTSSSDSTKDMSVYVKIMNNLHAGDIIQLENVKHSINAKNTNDEWIDATSLFDVMDGSATSNNKPIEFSY